jgi:hypothetical protein
VICFTLKEMQAAGRATDDDDAVTVAKRLTFYHAVLLLFAKIIILRKLQAWTESTFALTP